MSKTRIQLISVILCLIFIPGAIASCICWSRIYRVDVLGSTGLVKMERRPPTNMFFLVPNTTIENNISIVLKSPEITRRYNQTALEKPEVDIDIGNDGTHIETWVMDKDVLNVFHNGILVYSAKIHRTGCGLCIDANQIFLFVVLIILAIIVYFVGKVVIGALSDTVHLIKEWNKKK